MFLRICVLDTHGQVVMRDGSALPLAEGEGGAARIIRERETVATEPDVSPSMEETESEVLTSGTSNYADSSDYGSSSTYDYMHAIDEFPSQNFMSSHTPHDDYHFPPSAHFNHTP